MKRGLLTYIMLLAIGSIQAQTESTAPKLVVSITIDQLRSDYLENFSSLYGNDGFKRLMRNGKVYYQTDFEFRTPDEASSIATISTGTTPSVHGIVSNEWFDIHTLNTRNCVDDSQYIGNFTILNSSAAQLLASTVADELKVQTNGSALVYSIAPTREAAILSVGHAANCALWLNDANGKWCSTTYYNDFPYWINQYNDKQSPDYTIKGTVWAPTLPVENYRFLPTAPSAPFKYQLTDDRINQYRHLIASPFINDEVNKLTEELLNRSEIGKDNTPDYLALTYYTGYYNHQGATGHEAEIQDAYVRTDRSLAQLLNLLDRKIGLNNLIVCVSSTGGNRSEATEPKKFRIPTGEFYLNRCATLLNVYLMATYGEGQYVEAYYDKQIFLNHKLIESKQLNLSDIQEKAAQFLIQFSGVNEVYSETDLLLGSWSPLKEKVRNGYHRNRSGDLLLEILPGWTIVNEKDPSLNETVYSALPSTPFIIYGAGVKPETVRTPISAKRIAPTLASALHIRAPNASEAFPLDF